MQDKELTPAYVLACLGILSPFPLAGLHRFYLGQPFMGLLYLFTFGFCGLGTLIDLIRMPHLVARANLERRMLAGHFQFQPQLPASTSKDSPKTDEHRLLEAAKKHGGSLTVATASLETGIPLAKCRRILDRLQEERYCTRDVSEEGADLYVFLGLRSTKPFDVDAI